MLTESQHATWDTATLYLFIHGLGILLLQLLSNPGRLLQVASRFLFAGTVFFSGSLYLLCLAPELTWLGPVTPVGGICFIIGWAIAAFAFFKKR